MAVEIKGAMATAADRGGHLRSIAAVAALALLSLGAPLSAAFHYEAPSDCQWTLMNSSAAPLPPSPPGSGAAPSAVSGEQADVALHCRLRTINSQFDQTNFSVVPRDHTVALSIECSDSLLYQRYFSPLALNSRPSSTVTGLTATRQ